MTILNLNIEHKSKGKEKVCRVRGGESCAFDGALIVLQPIADAVHLIHGTISCLANSWQGRGTVSERGDFHRRGFSTDLREIDLILGTEERLNKAIDYIAENIKPEAIFVYATCVTGLLGEDLERICREATKRLSIDVIPVNAPGFIGPKNLGNRLAGEVLLEYVIGKEDPPVITERDINLIGEYNIAGDQFYIEPLLNEAGFRILSRITGNSTFKEIKGAHRAKLNVIICGRALLNVGIEMERKYGIPFVEVSFFGKREIATSLRKIAKAFKKSSLINRVEEIIHREEEKLNRSLQKYSELRGKRAVLYTGGVKSWSMISAIKDLGMEVVGVGLKKATYEDEAKIREMVNEDCLLFEDTSAGNILKIMKDQRAHILIAGGRNQYLAIKEGIPFVDVNQERHRAYAGYKGLINLAEDISKALRFYSFREKTLPVLIKSKKDITIDPLKNSPFVGAVMALQGIDRIVPILHAAQGCNFLGKVLLIKHFREPISMISTKLFTEDVVLDGSEKLTKAIDDSIKKGAELVVVLTSALSHMKGENVVEVINQFNKEYVKALHLPVPDYDGGLERGYARAVEAMLSLLSKGEYKREQGQVNLLLGSHLTPADFTVIRQTVEFFGIKPILLPDLSSLDGGRAFSGITQGGTTIKEIKAMTNSEFTLVIGESLASAGEILKERFGIDYRVVKSLCGLSSFDEFLKILSQISGVEIPDRFKRERESLIDLIRDAHFYLAEKQVAVALEPDHVLHLSSLIRGSGMALKLTILPEKTEKMESIQSERVLIGSINDIEDKYDLLISNSHATYRAKRLKIPLYEMGFPVYKKFGYPLKVTVGYRGGMNIICDLVNLLIEEEQ